MSTIFSISEPASGDRLIGRRKLIDDIVRYLRDDKKNVSLVGLPQVGKTSVARAALDIISKDSADSRIITAEVNLGTMGGANKSFEECWRSIINRLHGEVGRIGERDDILDEEHSALNKGTPVSDEYQYTFVKNHVEMYLSVLKDLDIRVIVFVDEFDAARDIFAKQRFYYEFFRNVASSGDYSIKLLFSSRQLIKRVETNAYGNSTLFGIFEEVPVREFDNSDMERYFELLAKETRGYISSEERDIVLNIAGRFPYLLNHIGGRAVDMYKESGHVDFKMITEAPEHRLKIDQCYNHIYNHITSHPKDDMLTLIFKAVIGPRHNISRADLDMLRGTGYLSDNFIVDRDDPTESWTVISPGFMDYLWNQRLSVPVWENLTRIQSAIQALITRRLPEMYGCVPSAVDTQLLNDRDIMSSKAAETYDRFVQNNKLHYPNGRGCSVVDVVPIDVLGRILKKFWIGFSDDFGGTPTFDRWHDAFHALNIARNPPAHAKPEFLSEAQIIEANAYCDEIAMCLGLNSAHKGAPM